MSVDTGAVDTVIAAVLDGSGDGVAVAAGKDGVEPGPAVVGMAVSANGSPSWQEPNIKTAKKMATKMHFL